MAHLLKQHEEMPINTFDLTYEYSNNKNQQGTLMDQTIASGPG